MSFLSDDAGRAVQRYQQFVLDGIEEQRRNEFHSGTREGRILGDDAFADEALARANQRHVPGYGLADVIGAVSRIFGVSEEELKAPGKVRVYSEARAVAALLVLETAALSLTDLGVYLQRDIAPLSRAGRRIATLADDNGLRQKLAAVRNELVEIAISHA